MKRTGNVALQQATDDHFKQYVEHEDLLQVVYYLSTQKLARNAKQKYSQSRENKKRYFSVL
jgi:hypothetical protein